MGFTEYGSIICRSKDAQVLQFFCILDQISDIGLKTDELGVYCSIVFK